MQKITSKDLKKLFKPKKSSHKHDNGTLLIIGGSKKYHGAPWYAIEAASKIVDLIYYSSLPENNKLMEKIKSKTPAFITISRQEIPSIIKEVDCILMGPGLSVSKETKRLVNGLLKKFPTRKFVLDADALKIVNLKLLNRNMVVTPHSREFTILFNKKASPENARKMARKHKCVILLKGIKDIVCSAKMCKYNLTGNQGMTKGGTGDVLAGLVAGLACRNDLFLAAGAAAYLNGLAGDQLKQKVGFYYNAVDLIQGFPKILKKYV